jgi:hypothetical protein
MNNIETARLTIIAMEHPKLARHMQGRESISATSLSMMGLAVG